MRVGQVYHLRQVFGVYISNWDGLSFGDIIVNFGKDERGILFTQD